jgi:putative tryptophan/tyrosine transport system substrate-binding protein
MRARLACLLGILIALTSRVAAQPLPGLPVVAMLCPESCSVRATESDAPGSVFQRALRARGHIEGKTLLIDTRAAGVSYAELSRYAERLARLRSAAILAEGWAATEAARKATSTIPVIMVGVPDAERGLVKSLARPGGNVSGVSYPYEAMAAKQLELLREVVPKAARVGILLNPANPEHEHVLPAVQTAARRTGHELTRAEVRLRSDIAGAVSSLKSAGADAILVLGDEVLQSGEVLLQALNYRLPTISLRTSFVEAGGLMSYGPSQVEIAERVAFFVDRILRGASPSSLPVEQPTRYQLVVNVTTANALGLTIPQSILLRADRVIE